ncbi:MAG TPA: GH1 family beta-glucosidase [Anaerolineae bacterium]|jgi:beta-glucosidase
MTANSFPPGFVWGTATASYQIEGAVSEDGRGESIWDRFSHTPGLVTNGDTGDVACDHYHLYKDDIKLMKSLGVKGYRFSIAWPRIMPNGTGRVNQKGLDFYNRVVDELLAVDIRPFVTLYHWDLPVELHDKGGWTNRDIAGWFSDYATVVTKSLGDRVRDWITLNEPWCTAFLGYATGDHAPGIRNPRLAVQAVHNTMLAHGMGMQAIRSVAEHPARVGITLNMGFNLPATDSEADREAAERSVDPLYEWFVVPIFNGHYSERLLDRPGGFWPEIKSGDMAIISSRNDFLGLNYYSPTRISGEGGISKVVRLPNAEYTEMDWEVEPEGLYRILLKLSSETKGAVPIYITENGSAFADVQSSDGRIHDLRRSAYLKGHLAAAQRAIAEGVDLRGYFEWSLIDNFEWAYGYTKKFGLISVDMQTQQRVIKDSGYYYRDIIAAGAVS